MDSSELVFNDVGSAGKHYHFEGFKELNGDGFYICRCGRRVVISVEELNTSGKTTAKCDCGFRLMLNYGVLE